MDKENKTVLIVEDDEFFRRAITSVVADEGFKVLEAAHGVEARDIICASKIDLVVSDVQMPHWTGVELLSWLRKERKSEGNRLPFILMTGFAHLYETKEADELGVEGFLSKPFEDDELLKVINEVFGGKDHSSKTKEMPVSEYCKVSIDDFITDKGIEMDVYIRLKSAKYIKIAHKGGKIPEERIQQYKEKGISQLYIRREDFRKVIDFNIKLTKLVTGSSKIDAAKKKRFMTHTGNVILENTFVNGVNQESFEDAKEFLMTSVGLLAEDDQTFSLLDILNSHVDHLYAHSLGVSMYSVMIAKAMGWTSTANLFKLSFGGLMHDIGKKEIDPEILLKSRALFTHSERKLLESHPMRGKEILEALKSAPSDVVAIAYQHHENHIGHGFPRQLGKLEIHPMAKIVAVADDFCNYALKTPTEPAVPAVQAIQLMNQMKKEQHDPKCYQAFLSLFSDPLKKAG